MHAAIVLLAGSLLSVDVGYQPLPDGGVEYIIQIEPELVDVIRRGEKDVTSTIPADLDVRKVRVTIGNAQLPHVIPTGSAARQHSQAMPLRDEPQTLNVDSNAMPASNLVAAVGGAPTLAPPEGSSFGSKQPTGKPSLAPDSIAPSLRPSEGREGQPFSTPNSLPSSFDGKPRMADDRGTNPDYRTNTTNTSSGSGMPRLADPGSDGVDSSKPKFYADDRSKSYDGVSKGYDGVSKGYDKSPDDRYRVTDDGRPKAVDDRYRVTEDGRPRTADDRGPVFNAPPSFSQQQPAFNQSQPGGQPSLNQPTMVGNRPNTGGPSFDPNPAFNNRPPDYTNDGVRYQNQPGYAPPAYNPPAYNPPVYTPPAYTQQPPPQLPQQVIPEHLAGKPATLAARDVAVKDERPTTTIIERPAQIIERVAANAEDRPWGPLIFVTFLLFMSLSANMYLGLVAWNARLRYESLVDKFRSAPSSL